MKATKGIIAAMCVSVICLSFTGCASSNYKTAKEKIASRDYESAIELLIELGNYKDSAQLLEEVTKQKQYEEATALLEEKMYSEAADLFKLLSDYQNSAAYYRECIEQLVVDLLNENRIADATELISNCDPACKEAIKDTVSEIIKGKLKHELSLVSANVEEVQACFDLLQATEVDGDLTQIVSDTIELLPTYNDWKNFTKMDDQYGALVQSYLSLLDEYLSARSSSGMKLVGEIILDISSEIGKSYSDSIVESYVSALDKIGSGAIEIDNSLKERNEEKYQLAVQQLSDGTDSLLNIHIEYDSALHSFLQYFTQVDAICGDNG